MRVFKGDFISITFFRKDKNKEGSVIINTELGNYLSKDNEIKASRENNITDIHY